MKERTPNDFKGVAQTRARGDVKKISASFFYHVTLTVLIAFRTGLVPTSVVYPRTPAQAVSYLLPTPTPMGFL